jgi:hypothetical protein
MALKLKILMNNASVMHTEHVPLQCRVPVLLLPNGNMYRGELLA